MFRQIPINPRQLMFSIKALPERVVYVEKVVITKLKFITQPLRIGILPVAPVLLAIFIYNRSEKHDVKSSANGYKSMYS